MFGVRLLLDGTQRGALNFYARQPGMFADIDLALGAIFANHASLALLNATHQANAEHLQLALDSNRQIGIAIGILTSRQPCTPDQAFDPLRAASQHLHRKLHDIAAHVNTHRRAARPPLTRENGGPPAPARSRNRPRDPRRCPAPTPAGLLLMLVSILGFSGQSDHADRAGQPAGSSRSVV
jgi:ANTAR domain